MTAVRERAGAFRWWARSSVWRVVAALTVGVVLVGACSGGDDSSDADVGGLSVTTTLAGAGPGPTTTVPPTTTTVPATTTTVGVTSSTTTVQSTTTTTIAEPTLEELEAEIAAAYEDIYWGYWGCLRAPLDCDMSWLEPDSGSYGAMMATMEALAERDRFVGDDDVGYYVIESIEIAESGAEATVVTCWWSTAVLYTTPADPSRPAGPDNPPTIVNNTPSSGRQIDEFVLFDGSWLVSGGRLVGDDYEEDQCGGPR